MNDIMIEKLRDENKRLCEYIDRISENHRERESHNSKIFIAAVTGSICAGFVMATFAAPLPKSKGDCGVYKVEPKTVTSFVLKPPTSPIIEKESCPVTPKCEQQATPEPENVSKVEVTNVDESKSRRHRRRHRIRAYWR